MAVTAKPFGTRKPRRLRSSPRFAIFAPTWFDGVAVDLIHGQDEGTAGNLGLPRKYHLDAAGDDLEAVFEFLVTAVRERNQIAHHLVDVHRQRRQVAADESHAEGLAGVQHFLGGGHQFQRVVVGRQQRAEIAVVLPEGRLHRLRCKSGPGPEQIGKTLEHGSSRKVRRGWRAPSSQTHAPATQTGRPPVLPINA